MIKNCKSASMAMDVCHLFDVCKAVYCMGGFGIYYHYIESIKHNLGKELENCNFMDIRSSILDLQS